MKRTDLKSHCPVNFALEVVGDPWSLLIVRDIVFWGKKTYGEFLASDEHIATNMLAQRLHLLETKGILSKKHHPADKRKEVYELTDKGLDLIPVLIEMAGWSALNDPATTVPLSFVKCVAADRRGMFELIRQTVSEGGSLFRGSNSVVQKIDLSGKGG